MERDRDGNYVPDWQEDENYIDEAPYRSPDRSRRPGLGCAGLLAVLLAAAARAALKRR
jgi:hypothetical protein